MPLRKTREEVRREFAERLQRLMTERDWNQSDLARRAFGTTTGGGARGRDNISGYVRAQSLPGPVHLKALARALNVSEDELLPGGAQAVLEAQPAPFRMEQLASGRVLVDVHQEVSSDTARKIWELLTKDAGS